MLVWKLKSVAHPRFRKQVLRLGWPGLDLLADLNAEWFRDAVIGAGVKSLDLVEFAVVDGQDDDADVGCSSNQNGTF